MHMCGIFAHFCSKMLKRKSRKDCPRTPSLMFRRKSKLKKSQRLGFSMESGLASIALTASKGVGIMGVEDMIHNAICQYANENEDSCQAIMKYVADNIIGKDLVYKGPFGPRKVVYCDYTASGKSVQFIEDYIRDEVLPYYGNTHTTTTVSSLHTGSLRHEAKQIIRKCTNTTDEDAVIFVSSGTTGAIGKLLHALQLKSSPIVFISPYEHHSNLLPWLEMGAEIIYGEETVDGTIDLKRLEEILSEYSAKERPMIGSFSAASNITGILSPVDSIATLLHKYGAYAFFDYATAGPYVEIDMNPHLKDKNKSELSYKDAIFCSIHKFIGGPGTPGLLVAKKHVFINPVPSGVGGGTVLFVTHNKHHYIDDIEEREEGGTPAIVESIRAGLVFQLKEEVTTENILACEHKYLNAAYQRWADIPNLFLLGKSTAERLPIFALVIKHPYVEKLLHHNYVSALLNDLFGVQARGGCACAGPYAEDLLGIDADMALKIADSLLGNFSKWTEISDSEKKSANGKILNVLKPGFCRLNLPYFADGETIDYIVNAVAFVAEHGWNLLPMYEMNPESGDFKHKTPFDIQQLSQLSDVKVFKRNQNKRISAKSSSPSFKEALQAANDILANFVKQVKKEPAMHGTEFLPDELLRMITWFLQPHEAHAMIRGFIPDSCLNYQAMFIPRKLPLSNEISRRRLKSGINKDSFCTCAAQKTRHKKNYSCMPVHEDKKGCEEVNSNLKNESNEQGANIFNNGCKKPKWIQSGCLHNDRRGEMVSRRRSAPARHNWKIGKHGEHNNNNNNNDHLVLDNLKT